MWNDKGRSGYGDTNLDGTYDDVILGISPNGRQYRNEATLEQRDLSGWAYWNLRKQNTPEQEIPESLHARNETESMAHTLANGQANLAKYADPVVPKKVSKTPLKNKVIPQLTRYNNLTEQMKEIVAQYNAKEIDLAEYSLLMDITVAKRDRAKILLDKAMSLKPIREDDAQPVKASPKTTPQPSPVPTNPVKQHLVSLWTEAKVFLVGSVAACAGLMWLAN